MAANNQCQCSLCLRSGQEFDRAVGVALVSRRARDPPGGRGARRSGRVLGQVRQLVEQLQRAARLCQEHRAGVWSTRGHHHHYGHVGVARTRGRHLGAGARRPRQRGPQPIQTLRPNCSQVDHHHHHHGDYHAHRHRGNQTRLRVLKLC